MENVKLGHLNPLTEIQRLRTRVISFDGKFNIFSRKVGKTPFNVIFIILLFNQKSFHVLLIGGAESNF